MNVISQDGALASIHFVPDEVKPVKGINLPVLIKAIAERYAVVKAPTLDEARTTGAKFENGIFRDGDREIAIIQLGIFNDLVNVTATDTTDCEAVLEDLLAWLKTEFRFRDPTTTPTRYYQSDLVVKFDNDPSHAFEWMKSFISFIQEQMTPANARFKKPVDFSAIVFGTDPTAPGATPEFTVARRINTAWEVGLYFSKASMPTRAHIRALELLDRLLAKKK